MSHVGFSGIVSGLLSGTVGCASSNNRVALVVKGGGRDTVVGMRSANVKLGRRGASHLFRHFCRNGGGDSVRVRKAKVNLGLYETLIGVRKKTVETCGHASKVGNSYFRMGVPLNGRRLGPRRVLRRSNAGATRSANGEARTGHGFGVLVMSSSTRVTRCVGARLDS